MPRLLVLFFSWSVIARPARAEDDDPPLDDPAYTWLTTPPEQQLAADNTVIPVGKGAVFVPSITGPDLEAPVTLVDQKGTIQSVPTGARILLDPGPYVVVVSAGTPEQGTSVAITVEEGETSLVPVQWGALQIEVTDDHRVPFRGTYEVIRADTRQPVVTGFGADTLQGETLETWLLAPGIYRIVKPGRDYQTLRDFSTVYVPEAGFVRYRLVEDPDTGEFLGAGVLLPDDFGASRKNQGRWFESLVVGVDGSVVQNRNVIGVFNSNLISLGGFLDQQAAMNTGKNHLTALLQAEASGSQLNPQDAEALPFVKSTDRLRVDLLDTYSLKGPTGPYVRGSGETQMFPSEVLVTEDTTFATSLIDGSELTEVVAANQTFPVTDAFEPMILRQGAGINTSFFPDSRLFAFHWRFGFGMRQNLYAGALVLDDNSATSAVEYTEVPSFHQEGIESTVVAQLRLPGWVTYSTDLELFSDFDTLTEPSVEWRNTLSLRVTRNLALNYFANVDRLPQVVDATQVQQSVLLRASWDVL